MKRIFDGLKVIDCASFIAAPAAATVLSDFGADVIKIEPPTGDAYRQTFTAAGQPQSDENYCWLLDARNKRSLAVDLASADGKAILGRLVSTADVFITNYPSAVRRKLGFTYADLKARNEKLIYASFSGYGERGAEADKPGFDTTAWWARSGMMDGVRATSANPARSLGGMGDHPSSLALLSGILMALYRRQQTGEGGEVTSSLLANGLWANGLIAQAALCGAHVPPRPSRDAAPNALGNSYRCRDGLWLIIAIHNEDRQWPDLLDCLGAQRLQDDPRFATREKRLANSVALIAELDSVFASQDRAFWRDRLNAKHILFDIIATPADLHNDLQMIENDILVPFADGSGETINSPIWLSGETKVAPKRAPELGEHSDAILREAGFAEDEITRMRAAKSVA
ncbi:MAG: CoA transferase [Hyphomicrobiales bacterium]|nr:CoA transferase [Hyphomicrobiales bacterium]